MGERLTTPQAERATGATRWTLLRAQQAGTLRGTRDNRGRWVWDSDDLAAWTASRPSGDNPAPTGAGTVAIMAERAARAEGLAEGLRQALAQAETRAERAEAEAERWREEARRRRSWWPWG